MEFVLPVEYFKEQNDIVKAKKPAEYRESSVRNIAQNSRVSANDLTEM